MAARPVSAVRRAARLLARNSGGDSAPRGARERTGRTPLAAGRAMLRRSGRTRLGADRADRPRSATEPPPPGSCQAPGLGRLSPLICLLCCAASLAPTGYLLARPRSAAMRARCGLAGQLQVCRSPRASKSSCSLRPECRIPRSNRGNATARPTSRGMAMRGVPRCHHCGATTSRGGGWRSRCVDRSGRCTHAVRNRRSTKVCAHLADLPCFVGAIDQAECVQHEFSLIRDRAVCSHHDARADFVRIRALWLIPLDLKVRVTAHRLIAEPLDGA
jgi:hypothetical protein